MICNLAESRPALPHFARHCPALPCIFLHCPGIAPHCPALPGIARIAWHCPHCPVLPHIVQPLRPKGFSGFFLSFSVFQVLCSAQNCNSNSFVRKLKNSLSYAMTGFGNFYPKITFRSYKSCKLLFHIIILKTRAQLWPVQLKFKLEFWDEKSQNQA